VSPWAVAPTCAPAAVDRTIVQGPALDALVLTSHGRELQAKQEHDPPDKDDRDQHVEEKQSDQASFSVSFRSASVSRKNSITHP
jgi:hypothetical protein